MKTSNNGINFIKQVEGCKLKAYQDTGGVWTIGYGNTFYEDNSKVKKGDTITQQRADSLILILLPRFEKIVNNKIKIQLTQNQFDALVSHTWNTGGSNTLFTLINNKASSTDIKNWFLTKYITDNGKVVPGLINRRKKECDLYFK